MILRLNEDRDIPNNNQRISRFTRTARQNVSQRDKELFARKLVELARITQPYVERASRIFNILDVLNEEGVPGTDYIHIDGEEQDSQLILEYDVENDWLNLGVVSIIQGDDHFFWLVHDSCGNPFEGDLSTNFNEMLDYTNRYGWDDLSQEDRQGFMEYINADIEQTVPELEDLFDKVEEELNSILINEEIELEY